MRLARKNDDPVLLQDLQRLAGRDAGAVAVADPDGSDIVQAGPVAGGAEAGTGGRGGGFSGDDLEAAKAALAGFKRPPLPPEVAALGPFEQRFVRTVVHVRRFLPFYAGAAVWVFSMLLIQPLGGGSGDAELAGAISAPGPRQGVRAATTTPAAPAAPAAAASPVFDDFGGSSFSTSPSFSSSFSTFDDDDDEGGDDTSFTMEPSDASASSTNDADAPIDFGDDEEDADEPQPLVIVAGGYTSATGGTPLEQDPAAGALPVHAAAGRVQKHSFVKLSGEETTLRLKLVDGGINAETAAVKVCVITADWSATRGGGLDATPAFDAGRCASGRPAGPGVRQFDLDLFGPNGDGFGYVITVGADTAPPTYQVAFEPVVAPPPSSSEG